MRAAKTSGMDPASFQPFAIHPAGTTPPRFTPRELLADAVVAVSRGDLLLMPPTGSAEPGNARVLTKKEARAIPALVFIADALPPPLRLIVATWADGAAIVSAAPRNAGPPPDWWLRSAHDAAVKAGRELLRQRGATP